MNQDEAKVAALAFSLAAHYGTDMMSPPFMALQLPLAHVGARKSMSLRRMVFNMANPLRGPVIGPVPNAAPGCLRAPGPLLK